MLDCANTMQNPFKQIQTFNIHSIETTRTQNISIKNACQFISVIHTYSIVSKSLNYRYLLPICLSICPSIRLFSYMSTSSSLFYLLQYRSGSLLMKIKYQKRE